MLTVTTKRPIIDNPSDYTYSNARGDSKDGNVKADDRLRSQKSKNTRQEARDKSKIDKELLTKEYEKGSMSRRDFRKEKRNLRKAKRNATKLQILKRFSKDGKPLFVYRLKKLVKKSNGKAKKTMPDGTEVEVKKENQVITPQGIYDLTEIVKALGITNETFLANQSDILNKLIALETGSKNQSQAIETLKTNPDIDLAVNVPIENIEQSEDGFDYIQSETQEKTDVEVKDVADEDKKKQGMSTTTKVIIGVASTVVLGLIGYIIYNSTKNK